jgi:tRNA 2-thiouridine synthesizing protein A
MNREGLKEVLVNMQESYKEMKEEFEDKTDYVLDTSGTNCPLPIIKTKKELNGMKIGETLKMISTDPGAVGDIKSLCEALKQALEKTIEEDNKFIFIIRKTT